MNRDELAALPPVLDVPTAAKVLGIGRSLAYDLVRHGQWPTAVLRVGKLIKIPTGPLIRLLDPAVDAVTGERTSGTTGTLPRARRQGLPGGV